MCHEESPSAHIYAQTPLPSQHADQRLMGLPVATVLTSQGTHSASGACLEAEGYCPAESHGGLS